MIDLSRLFISNPVDELILFNEKRLSELSVKPAIIFFQFSSIFKLLPIFSKIVILETSSRLGRQQVVFVLASFDSDSFGFDIAGVINKGLSGSLETWKTLKVY